MNFRCWSCFPSCSNLPLLTPKVNFSQFTHLPNHLLHTYDCKITKTNFSTGRTWQSLKERFRKRIMTSLQSYIAHGLSNNRILELERSITIKTGKTYLSLSPHPCLSLLPTFLLPYVLFFCVCFSICFCILHLLFFQITLLPPFSASFLRSQINFLTWKHSKKLVKNVKVIGGEECIPDILVKTKSKEKFAQWQYHNQRG